MTTLPIKNDTAKTDDISDLDFCEQIYGPTIHYKNSNIYFRPILVTGDKEKNNTNFENINLKHFNQKIFPPKTF